MAIMATLALAMAGCAGSDEEGGAGSQEEQEPDGTFRTGLVGDQPDGGDPTEGGILHVSAFSEVQSLDPAVTIAGGLSGGNELAAVYDVLLRHDPETGEYSPHLAEGLEPNDDATTWTLTLREDVEFSDGTPLDADAVVASIERYVANGGNSAALWQRQVESMDAPDDRTVEFTLTRPWPGFEYMLASGPGMIVAPAADRGGEFTPIGAGPFTFGHHKPSEELVLEANPNYWGGEPALDGLRFTVLQTAEGTLDVLESGGADAAAIREPHVIEAAVDAGFPGAMTVVNMGVGLLVNTQGGSATADERVRRAVAMALDPEVVFERTYDGVGLPGSEMFQGVSRWHLDERGPQPDLAAAEELVEEAKRDGFDGTVRYLGIQNVSTSTGVAIEAMLGRIGLEVEPTYASGAAEMIQTVFGQRDFDLAGWSFGVRDAAVFPGLFERFHSESSGNGGGFQDEEMDTLIDELGEAADEDTQRTLLAQIQERWNETVPAVIFGAQPEYLGWQEDVHGIQQHVSSMVLFGEAWLDR